MVNRILTTEGWQQRIRDKMGVDDTYLPDSAIEQPDIIGIAETNIISQIHNYTAFEGDAKTYLESAVVLECCILLCPSMAARLPKKETGPHAGHELWINWDNKKMEFTEERNTYINNVFELSGLSYPSTLHFKTTHPVRKW